MDADNLLENHPADTPAKPGVFIDKPPLWFVVAVFTTPLWWGIVCGFIFSAAHSIVGNLLPYEQPMLLLVYSVPIGLALTLVSISRWFRSNLLKIMGAWLVLWLWAYLIGSSYRAD